MQNLLGVDVGTVRVGVAILGPDSLRAVPLGIYKRAQKVAEQAILTLIQRHGIKKLVVGLPLNDKSLLTQQCEDVIQFIRRLGRRTTVEVVFVDEYLSTEEVKQSSKRKVGEPVDDLSAAYLLQEYLDGKVVPFELRTIRAPR